MVPEHITQAMLTSGTCLRRSGRVIEDVMRDVREVNIRVRMLCLIMLMSMTRLRRSLINRIMSHVFLIMIRLRRIRRRLVIGRLIMLCLRMAFQLMAALAACINRQYSPHPLQLLSSTGCYLSVRRAGTVSYTHLTLPTILLV